MQLLGKREIVCARFIPLSVFSDNLLKKSGKTLDFSDNLWYTITVIKMYADLAHLVERNLAKVEVAGSIPVIRSKRKSTSCEVLFSFDFSLDFVCGRDERAGDHWSPLQIQGEIGAQNWVESVCKDHM